VVHQVGHSRDPLRGHIEGVHLIGVGARGSGLGNRHIVILVEGEADRDSTALRLEERARDELRRRLLEIEVVERDVEGLLRR
jgi:hypothetical protein